MDLKLIVLALVVTFSSGDKSTVKDAQSSVVITPSKNEELKSFVTPSVSTIQPAEISLKTIANISNVNENISNSVNKSEILAPVAASEIKPAKSEINQTNVKEISLNSSVTEPSVTTKPVITTKTSAPDINGKPEPGEWKIYNNESKSFCIIVHLELQFNLTYPSENGFVKNTTLFIPKNANVSGNCLNSTQNIKLEWGEGNSFEINFAANKTSKNFGIDLFRLVVNTSSFENVKENVSNIIYANNKTGFPLTPFNMSYKCDKRWIKNLTSVNNLYVATLIMSHVQVEAFRNSSSAMFSEAKDCEGFDTPDIVPIAVGLVLSVLVFIVLAAYLIGRRRSQNRGYLSM